MLPPCLFNVMRSRHEALIEKYPHIPRRGQSGSGDGYYFETKILLTRGGWRPACALVRLLLASIFSYVASTLSFLLF